MIPYAKPDVDEGDIAAVVEVLRSDWLTQGPAQERFERAMAAYCGVKHAVTVAHATGGLHIAYRALGLEPGKTLWTSPNTFVASANAALYCGAGVDFVDIDPRTYNFSPERFSEKLKRAKAEGSLPSVVVPVHFAGQSCLMREIAGIARAEGISVVEDAAHAVGGCYEGRPVGCCQWSDAAVFSFHAVKGLTTGEGGMVLTNRDDVYESLLRLRTHGITRKEELFQGTSDGPWYYEQVELGYHYRMTDIQAALGESQLRRLDGMVARRREIVRAYNEAFAGLPLVLPWQHPDTDSSWHLYTIRLRPDFSGKTHRGVFEALRAGGIGVNLHYIPVHLQPYYRKFGFGPGDFPEAEKYYGEVISLPLFSRLTDDEMERVISTVRTVMA